MNTVNTATAEKFVKKPTLKKIIAGIIAFGVLCFGMLAYFGLNPLTALNYVSVPLIGPISPKFLFAVYGEDAKGKMKTPMGVEIANNRLYVSDAGNHRIQVFDMKGRPLFTFGKFGAGAGKLNYPYGLAADNTDLYVADMHNGRVAVFDLNGNFKKYFGGEGKKRIFRVPTNIFVAADRVYITDAGLHSLLVFDKQGKQLFKIGGTKGNKIGQLVYPNAVLVKDDSIYISDSGNNRVQIFDLNGKFIKLLAGETKAGEEGQTNNSTTLINPRGLGIDPKGVLYVASPILNTITVFDLEENKQLFAFGSSGPENDQFYVANDIAIDDQGRIYIADKGNNRVAVYGF